MIALTWIALLLSFLLLRTEAMAPDTSWRGEPKKRNDGMITNSEINATTSGFSSRTANDGVFDSKLLLLSAQEFATACRGSQQADHEPTEPGVAPSLQGGDTPTMPPPRIMVTARVMSGVVDPFWWLSRSESSAFLSLLDQYARVYVPRGTARVLGYRGFVVQCAYFAGTGTGIGSGEGRTDSSTDEQVDTSVDHRGSSHSSSLRSSSSSSSFNVVFTSLVAGHAAFELFLLDSVGAAKALSPAIASHILDAVLRAESGPGPGPGPGPDPATTLYPLSASTIRSLATITAVATCAPIPIVGPDTPPVYDPATDDLGCFITDQTLNNCYNYANDVVTDTFAQPGRGTAHKWITNNCTDVTRAAESDGLSWYGNTLPKDQPPEGHFVAMLIWPDTNFHWIRHDNTSYWSHKPGGTEVRNVDNNGALITDPSKADFAPWTQFCGYFITVPSNVTIS